MDDLINLLPCAIGFGAGYLMKERLNRIVDRDLAAIQKKYQQHRQASDEQTSTEILRSYEEPND